jgi:hypothetical protein
MFLNKLIEKKHFSFFILFFLAAISFYRSPDIFLEGRFWGEDGSIYFQNALKNNFLENFFKIYYPTEGYYNLFPRIVALTANSVSIEFAALVNVYMSYSILFYIFILAIFSNSFLLENKKQKFLFCFLILFCPSFVPEVWINSVNTQIYFCALSLLILYSRSNNGINFKIINFIALFIGGFSSSYVAVLFPFFFIKYYLIKSKNFLFEAFIVLFSFLFQLSFYLISKSTLNMIGLNRGNAFLNNFSLEWINLSYLKILIYNVFLKTIFSKKIVLLLQDLINYLDVNKFLLSSIITSIFIIITIFLYKIIIAISKDKKKIFILFSLFSIFITILTMNILVSGSYIYGRYAAILGFIFSLIVLFLNFQKIKKKYLSRTLNILLISIYLSGMYQFRPNDYQILFLDCLDDCKPWKEQIISNDNNIILWPYNTANEWILKLNR